MSFRRFEYFLVVAEELNFSRAAKRLYISQQALSIHIRKLEEEYGTILFERKPSLHLTLAGEYMVSYVRQMLSAEAAMSSRLSGISQDVRGRVLVGLSQLRAQTLFPAVWESFHPLYPNVSVTIRDVANPQMENALLKGNIDVYIGVNTMELPTMVSHHLWTEKMVVLVREELLRRYCPQLTREQILQYQNGVNLEEFIRLADFPYVFPSIRTRARNNIDHFFHENGIMPNVLIESNSQALAWDLCLRGNGVGIVSEAYQYDRHRDASSGHCLIFPIQNRMLQSEICIVYLRGHTFPSYVTNFIQIAEQTLRTKPEPPQAQSLRLRPADEASN